MYLVKPHSRDKGSGRRTKCLLCSPFKFLGTKTKGGWVSTRYLVPGGGGFTRYIVNLLGLNTHGVTQVCPTFVRNENQPKDRSFRPDIPADIRPKTSVRPAKSWKNKHFGTDMPRGRPRKNFSLKNFGLIFHSPV